jgi:uncharacterized phage protein (TIGR01671 family)
MREIKFRGKCSDSRWIYGSSLRINEQFISIGYRDFLWKDVTPDTVGQFTGLYDVDGKEIYEGDIIKGINNFRHVVVYGKSCASFVLRWGNEENSEFTIYDSFIHKYEYRVIGNIHDNPELLSKTK